MRTVRSSGRIWGGVYLVPGGVPGPRQCTWSGGVPGPRQCTWSGGVPGPRGCTWSWGVYLVPGVCVPGLGGSVLGVVPGQGGCVCSRGVVPGPRGVPGPWEMSALGGVPAPGGCLLLGGCTWSGTPPCGQTDACKNITFATSLRTVIKQEK